jgi:hypothetical protein
LVQSFYIHILPLPKELYNVEAKSTTDLAFWFYEYYSHLFLGSHERSVKTLPKNQPKLKLISLENVVVEPVRWLWYPYIPLGKLTILHGDPGEGKTTLALWIAAACSRGQALPGGEIGEPLTVLYQTAEDGFGDTIKPRLLESKADLRHIYTIDETDFPLSMLDERIGEAIEKTHAQLMILDPMQAYLGEKVDMNRANEVRTVMKGLTKVANQTGCAIVLVGHLNKSQSANSAQRGLGSMDFRAAARSVLLVGRVKNDRDIRAMVHDKSSLAPEGPSRAFSLENGTLRWQKGYETLTADQLLSGRSQDSKLTLAEELILDTLDRRPAVPAKEMFSLAQQAGISARTLKSAKGNLRDYVQSVRVANDWLWRRTDGSVQGGNL